MTFETNEGDTPRVLASAMCSSWPNPKRGSLPVAWAIDPLLAERFPALFGSSEKFFQQKLNFDF